MLLRPEKEPLENPELAATVDRRAFLKSAALLGGAAVLLGSRPLRVLAQVVTGSPGEPAAAVPALGESAAAAAEGEAAAPAASGAIPEIRLPPAIGGKLAEQSQLCMITDRRMLDSFGRLRDDTLPEALHRLLKQLTGLSRVRDVWKPFLRPDDIIGIKFDPMSADALGTDEAFVRALVVSLVENGYTAEQIMLIDPPTLYGVLRTKLSPEPLKLCPCPRGYEEKALELAGGKTAHASRALSQVTAIINVATIKEHRQLGLSCGLSNLALGMINNPGAFATDGGADALPALAAMKEIGGKHRLTIVNGIRGIFDRGPRAEEEGANVWWQHCIMATADVVAADAKALELLEVARQSHDLPTLSEAGREPKYLAAAERAGLGHAGAGRIRVQNVGL